MAYERFWMGRNSPMALGNAQCHVQINDGITVTNRFSALSDITCTVFFIVFFSFLFW
jgi:hypothetical protein